MNRYYFYSIIGLIAAIGIFSYFAAIHAQTDVGITFPVKELGGCKDRQECFSYCNRMDNIPSCVSFAQKHNLLDGKELEDAKKLADLVSRGVKTPGNCASKESCENYCRDTSRLEECLDFGEKAGFVSPDEAIKARKFMPFVLKGETPGGCKNKDECESYCADSTHLSECVDFAEKAGIMDKEEAEMVRKTGGQGPGGCNSKDSCDSFCNKQENQETCFNFAKDHDLIPSEKLQEIQNGVAKLKTGLTQAPPELVNCLKDGLGQNIIEQIQNGTLVPGPDIGEKMQACLNTSLSSVKFQMRSALKNAPKEFEECLSGKIGMGNFNKMKEGELSEDMMRNFGEMMQNCKQSLVPPSMSPEIKTCLNDYYGTGFIDKALSGEVQIPEDLNEQVGTCAKKWANSQINSCLNLSCSEFFSCMQKLQASGGQGGGNEAGGQSNAALENKIESCGKEMQQKNEGQNNMMERRPQPPVQPPSGEENQNYQYKADCSAFVSAPSCSYVGSEDSQSYKLCKQCFPNK